MKSLMEWFAPYIYALYIVGALFLVVLILLAVLTAH